MAKTKTSAVPDIRTLRHFMEEYLEMMREVEKIVKRALSLNPEKEEFWDYISDRAAEISMLGIRSETIVEEIDNLIDQLPED